MTKKIFLLCFCIFFSFHNSQELQTKPDKEIIYSNISNQLSKLLAKDEFETSQEFIQRTENIGKRFLRICFLAIEEKLKDIPSEYSVGEYDADNQFFEENFIINSYEWSGKQFVPLKYAKEFKMYSGNREDIDIKINNLMFLNNQIIPTEISIPFKRSYKEYENHPIKFEEGFSNINLTEIEFALSDFRSNNLEVKRYLELRPDKDVVFRLSDFCKVIDKEILYLENIQGKWKIDDNHTYEFNINDSNYTKKADRHGQRGVSRIYRILTKEGVESADEFDIVEDELRFSLPDKKGYVNVFYIKQMENDRIIITNSRDANSKSMVWRRISFK